MAYKTIASMLAQKHDKTYSKTFHWIRCKLSYSLLHSAIMCLRGEKIQHSPPCKYPQTQLTSPAMKARSLLCELNPQTLIPLVYTLHLCICVKEKRQPHLPPGGLLLGDCILEQVQSYRYTWVF